MYVCLKVTTKLVQEFPRYCHLSEELGVINERQILIFVSSFEVYASSITGNVAKKAGKERLTKIFRRPIKIRKAGVRKTTLSTFTKF